MTTYKNERDWHNTTQLYSMDDVRKANAKLGHHWFSPATMRFFKSRVLDSSFRGGYFVSSEQYSYDSARLYTVRQVKADGSIDTVGEFQQYATAAQAKRAIENLLKAGGNMSKQRLDEFMTIYSEELAKAVTEKPQEYGYNVDFVPTVVGRMRAAIERNSHNHDGMAFKGTCKRLGIKHTRKAINAFLEAQS